MSFPNERRISVPDERRRERVVEAAKLKRHRFLFNGEIMELSFLSFSLFSGRLRGLCLLFNDLSISRANLHDAMYILILSPEFIFSDVCLTTKLMLSILCVRVCARVCVQDLLSAVSLKPNFGSLVGSRRISGIISLHAVVCNYYIAAPTTVGLTVSAINVALILQTSYVYLIIYESIFKGSEMIDRSG